MKKHNFYAGPAILPEEVKRRTSESILEFAGMGLSVMEISHRSEQWVECMNKAFSLVDELLDIPKGYKVMFLTGGASSQFYMSAMNLLNESEVAGYINTGTWSAKSIKEAQLFGTVKEIGSSKNKNYTYVPRELDSDGVKYVHYTSNNTVFGTQFKELPNVDVPLIADMSSDIFSKKVDIKRHNLIYCGAQKNMGPAGVTLVIVRDDLIGNSLSTTPSVFDYAQQAEADSMLNTPPTYTLYLAGLVFKWVKKQGGLSAMAKLNENKANKLYAAIDNSDFYSNPVEKASRSWMNVPFVLANADLDKEFLAGAEDVGLTTLKGHRSIGGMRASIYNAMPEAGVDALIDYMKDFEKRNA
jgi:phosphoserine aminotransferase